MKELTDDGTKIEIDSNHNLILVNGSSDNYLAKILTTLKAYLIPILEKKGIENARNISLNLIMNGEIKYGKYIEIPLPKDLQFNRDVWNISLLPEAMHGFFIERLRHIEKETLEDTEEETIEEAA